MAQKKEGTVVTAAHISFQTADLLSNGFFVHSNYPNALKTSAHSGS